MNVADDPFASYRLLAKELDKYGYPLTLSKNEEDKLVATFTSPKGEIWKTRAGGLRYPFNDENTMNYSLHKNLSGEFAKKENVPIPFTTTVSSDESDEKLTFLLSRHPILVVKPTNSSLSKGLTLNVKTLADLKGATIKASTISDRALVQEQVEGEEVRLVCLDGKFVCALLRQTPSVVGDGDSTVSELIKQENKHRAKLQFEYIAYPKLDDKIIDKTLLTSDLVLAKDEIMQLNRSTMISGGCSVYNITEEINPGYIKIAERLTKKLGAGFLAIDIMSKDYSQPPRRDNYRFIEFNTSPSLKLFYCCRDGKQVDIVPKLVRFIDNSLHGWN